MNSLPIKLICCLCLICTSQACKKNQSYDDIQRTKTSSDLPLEVIYSGCREVLAGPVCLMDKKNRWLDLWTRSDPRAKISVSAATITRKEPITVQGGLRYELKLAPEATEIKVKADYKSSFSRWTLSIGEYISQFKEEEALLGKSQLDQATQMLQRKLGALGDR